MKAVVLLAVLVSLLLALALQAQADMVVNFNFEGKLSGASGGGSDSGGGDDHEGDDDEEDLEACPSYVRMVNGYTVGDINNLPGTLCFIIIKKRLSSPNLSAFTVPFRTISNYVRIPTGRVTLKAFGPNGVCIQSACQFFVQPGQFYTFAVTSPVVSPSSMLFSNASPFVYMENMQPPNPGKFRGKWYRCSNMVAVIDFRIFHPNAPNINKARLTILNPKTVMEYPELSTGLYNFNPVLISSSDPLVNPHTTNLVGGNNVEITNATTTAGAIFDVFALGAALGTPDVNSLRLSYSVNYPRYEATTGCLVL